MNYAIILAGGLGKRFWPLSNIRRPKQFLNFFSEQALIEETVLRISGLIDKKNIYIATSAFYKKRIKNYIKKLNLKEKNILYEPKIKNTFLPIAYLTYKIFNNEPSATIFVFPTDHYIKYKDRFLDTLKKAEELAQKNFIVTLGIRPTYPETEYGYIKVSRPSLIKNKNIFKVERFIEKPSLSKAKVFIKDRRYFWNAGIFIFKTSLMMDEIKRYQPYTYRLLNNLKDLNKFWRKAPSLSIDYAIMEKSKRLALIPFSGFWMDLGSFKVIEELFKKDKDKNVFKCKKGNIDMGSKNIFVWSDNRSVVTLGLKDIYIIDTDDSLLICRKDKIQELKKIIKDKNL